MSSDLPRALRCAIYTRKSSEEGLEQSFNSLDAQREACAAFVLSQRHEGWTEIPTHYDDGGYSGGNMTRPALTALMPEYVRWTTPGGGPVLWLELPHRIDLRLLTARLEKEGVLLDARLNEWFFHKPHLHGTRINYAQESIARTHKGLAILAKEIRALGV